MCHLGGVDKHPLKVSGGEEGTYMQLFLMQIFLCIIVLLCSYTNNGSIFVYISRQIFTALPLIVIIITIKLLL